MSKKDKKRVKKRSKQVWCELNKWADQQITHSAQSTMTVEFIHEGKLYKGVMPCVGEVEK